MKKLLTVIISCLAAVVVLGGCTQSPAGILRQKTGLNIPRSENVTAEETHGGFHGDGYTYYVFTFSEESGKTLENTLKQQRNWNPLPFDSTVRTLLYNENGHHYCQCEIPEIVNGYYFFYDEQTKSYSPPEEYLKNSYSFNFVISIYDCDNYLIYYYELDT